MRYATLVLGLAVGLGMTVPAESAAQGPPNRPAAEKENANKRAAQNRGQGQRPEQAQGQGQRPEQAQGRGQGQQAERRGPPAHARARRGGPAPDVGTYNRELVERAAQARTRRNGDARQVEVRREGGELRFVRDDGQVLFSLDRDRAEELGYWRAVVAPTARMAAQRPERDRRDTDIFGRVEDDRDARGGSPEFCRSGEGHPVWGRTWCLDKGFGLGEDRARWGRVTDVGDIILRQPRTDRERLDQGGLIDVLGDIVFGRLALQSLVLGAEDPLTGTWMGRDDGPDVLRVHSGDLPVAELVADDDRVEMVVINLGD